MQIFLPDGTKVWLLKNSELTYHKINFNKDSRTINLEGEGYFEVVKNPNKPFIINMDNTVTTVLGTSFNLKQDPKSRNVELVLVEGEVLFETSKAIQNILPGQKVVANLEGELTKTKNDDVEF